MSMTELELPTYEDGRTKQSFKDATDINKLLEKAAKGGTLSHLAKHGATYGDFSDIDDLLTAHARLERGVEIFNELPAEIRKEFNQSPQEFYNYVNNPANTERLPELLPGLAKQGKQRPEVLRTAENQNEPLGAPENTPPGPSLPGDVPPPSE